MQGLVSHQKNSWRCHSATI